MILQNNSQTRIFNGKGFEHEISLVLNLFKKYNGIYNILKIIKTQKIICFDLNRLLLKLNTYFLSKLNFMNNLTFKQLTFFSKVLDLFARSFFIFLFKSKLELDLKLSLFFNLKNKDNFKSSSSFYGKRKREILNRLFSSFNDKKNKRYLLQNKFYNHNFIKPRRNFLKDYLNKNNHNIFISGEVFGFYNGSITPFSKSNSSWFLSTGLKGDVECNELDLFNNLHTKESTPTFYDSNTKDIIFKVKNFHNKVITHIKKNVRHLLFYKTNQFFGFQRFFRESRVYFTLFQNLEFILKLDKIVHLKKSIQFIFSNKRKINTLKISKQYFGQFLKQTKILFIYFQLSKTLLDFFLSITKKQKSLITYSTYFYKSLIFFKVVSKKLLNIFKNLFLIKMISMKPFKLIIKNKKFKIIRKKTSISLNAFFFHLNFAKDLIKNIEKTSLFHHFFDIFLFRKHRHFFIKKLIIEDLTLTTLEKIEIYAKLLKRPYWFLTYKLFFYYFYFLIDWRLNFNILIDSKSLANYKNSYGFEEIIKPFKELQKQWEYNFFVQIKKLHSFFYCFLEEIIDNLKLFFYTNLNKKTNLNLKFLIASLFIHVSKLTLKDTEGDFFLVNDLIKLSSFFLGKWFYYRQRNKFIDNLFDYNYNLFNSSKVLNLSQKENYIYNLTKLNVQGIRISSKLDLYLKKNLLNSSLNITETNRIKCFFNEKIKPYKNRVTQHRFTKEVFIFKNKRRWKIYKKRLKEDLTNNINIYRSYRWFKKFSESSLNSLDIGFKFRLPTPSRPTRRRKRKKLRRGKHIIRLTQKRHNISALRRVSKKYVRRLLKKFFKNNRIKEQEILLTNTFLSIYTKTIKKKEFYLKLTFWFNK